MILHCPVCSLGLTAPAPVFTDADYVMDRVNDAAGFVEKGEVFRRLQREFAEFIRDGVLSTDRQRRSLDIGCSVGFLLEELSQLGFSAEGVELDQRSVDIARSRGLNVQQGVVDERFADASFDLVSMSHVLEHVLDLDRLLHEVRRVLRPNGWLALSQPCFEGLVPRIFGRYWYGWQPSQHYWHFSVTALRRLLTRHGFRVVAVKRNTLYHPWPPETHTPQGFILLSSIACVARFGLRHQLGDQFYLLARAAA